MGSDSIESCRRSSYSVSPSKAALPSCVGAHLHARIAQLLKLGDNLLTAPDTYRVLIDCMLPLV